MMRPLRYFLLVCLFLLFSAAAPILMAQVADPMVAAEAPKPDSGHHYIGSGTEMVDPATGNVSFDLPIATPAGRELSFPFGISYKSGEQFSLANDQNQVLWEPRPGNSWSAIGTSFKLPVLAYNGQIQHHNLYYPTPPPQGTVQQQCDETNSYVFMGFSGRQYTLPFGEVWVDPNYSSYTTCSAPNLLAFGNFAPATQPPTGQVYGVESHGHAGAINISAANITVADPSGTRYVFPISQQASATTISPTPSFPPSPTFFGSIASSITDRNGNQITYNGSGSTGSYLDTAGRTVVSWTGLGTYGAQFTVSGLGNIIVTYGTTSATFPETATQLTDPALGGCFLTPGATLGYNSISRIMLPNGQQYVFDYGTGGSNGGGVSRIVYPSGGYVNYTWGVTANNSATADFSYYDVDVVGGNSYSCTLAYQTPVVTERQVSFDGVNVALDQQFSYITNWSPNSIGWTSKQTTVTTKDLIANQTSKTIYTYTGITPDGSIYDTIRANSVPVESQVVYQDGSGYTLKTVNKAWLDVYSLAAEQTILDNGQATTTWRCYNQNDVLTDVYEYGFQSELAGSSAPPVPSCVPSYVNISSINLSAMGPLRRHTQTVLQNFATAANIMDEPQSETVYDGAGNMLKQTVYNYDQFGLQTSGAIQHIVPAAAPARGNATTVQNLITGSNYATTTLQYYDTGQIYNKTDACGNTTCSDMASSTLNPNSGSSHTTTYSYTDSYTAPAGQTFAYLTKVTRPSTLAAHIEQFTWDYNTGLLMSHSDENNLTTNYTYADSLLRLTNIVNPDGGQTWIAYNDTAPNPTVTTTKQINSTASAVSVSKMDGFGHVIETRLTSDPQGAVLSDTTYDGLGRAFKQSNPYRGNSDPTSSPGTTTYSYDALGRTTQVVKPDGSAIGTVYSGNCTTVTDETGRMRLSCTDGLGRLIEVEEPGGVGAAVPAAGSATIAINGSEQTYTYDPCQGTGHSCPTTIPDSGTVTVTVNGYSASSNYGSGVTVQQIVSSIANGLNASSVVTASVNGNVITLTATDPGAESNYYLITTSATWNTTYFSHPSFTASSSGFTGGTNGSLGSSPLVTRYSYDALNNLTCAVQQGTDTTAFTTCAAAPATWRPRSFTYDALSRLLTSYNPEAGNIGYTYDANSNLTTKTDARSITTTYTYDVLNRLTSRSYSNGDPANTIAYDQANCLGLLACQNIGYRTSMTDAAGSEAWAYQVDAKNSRSLHQNSRTTNGITKPSTYTLDLAGNVAQLAYPSGRIVNYTYNVGTLTANRAVAAVDSASGTLGQTEPSNGITYAASPKTPLTGCPGGVVCYTPQGSVYSMSLGQTSSFTGVNVNATFNNRLQPVEIKASSPSGNALDITYNFNDTADYPGTTQGHNAGHVYGIANNLNASRSQSFTYDLLNRIASAGTAATSGTYAWGYQYAYDNWGNLLAQSGWTPNYNGATETYMSAVKADNYNHISAMAYDPSGNALSDGNYVYTWNGESELKTSAPYPAGSPIVGAYTYDGDGRRAMKSGTTTKLYWYGSGGEILAETDASGNTLNEYIFFGGKRVAILPASSTAQYYVEDFLGSSRVMTNSTGAVCYDADFTPFGGERAYTNTCAQNAYKFEGKERDAETQNDDFGARYYTWRFGRWLSADWSAVPAPVPYANLTNPQTLNLYAMVADDPESFADLDGHCDANAPVSVGTGCGLLKGNVAVGPSGPVEVKTATADQNSSTAQNTINTKPPQPLPPPMAELKTDINGHTTTLLTTDKKDKLTVTTIETGNAVDHRAQPGAADPYTTHNVVGQSDRHAGERAYGPAGAFIDTGDPRQRDIHGGGSSLGVHAFDDQQPLTPTFGCTRGHNADVINLGNALTNFQQANPDVLIPYVRE